MSEVDDLLDDLEGQYNEGREPVEIEGEVEEVEAHPEVEEGSPPSFMSYEDWVAEGRDPDDYMGKKAYEARHDQWDKEKTMKRELREVKDTMKTVVDSIGEWKETETNKIRSDLETRLAQAKEDEDIDGALAVQEQLTTLDNKPAPRQQTLNPLIADFFEDNPVLDKGSNSFDVEALDDMQRIYNNKLAQLDDGTGQFTDGQIKKCLKASLTEVKSLNAHLFESQRNQRRTAPTKPKRPSSKKTGREQLAGVKVERSNPRDTDALNDIHDLIAKKDPKAAEQFAQAMGGE